MWVFVFGGTVWVCVCFGGCVGVNVRVYVCLGNCLGVGS